MTNLEIINHPMAVPAFVFACFLLVYVTSILWLRMRYKSKLAILNAKVADDLSQQETHWQGKVHSVNLELQRQQTLVESLQDQKRELQEEIASSKRQIETLLQENAKSTEQMSQLEKEKAFIAEAKVQLVKEFELTAGKLYDAKQEQISRTSKQSIETVITPFKTQLQDFNKRIEDMVHKENSQRNQLVGQINALQKQAHQLSAEANNLATALKGDNKAQGIWGEVILERLLEQSGLELGREYEKQLAYENEDGKRLKPDVVVHLPDGKDIVIDSKVSLIAYEQYVTAEDEQGRTQALSAHIESVKSHVKGLSVKNYEGLMGLRTLDFVFMFMPIEAAYVAAINGNPDIFRDAYEKSIVIVSPSSLMVALKTVETIWRHEKQNLNAEKIAQSAGRLYDQFVLMVNALDDVGNYLEKTQGAFELTKKRIVDGRGNLLNRVEQLRKLGAKTSKKLSAKYNVEDTDSQKALILDDGVDVEKLE